MIGTELQKKRAIIRENEKTLKKALFYAKQEATRTMKQ